MIGTLRDFKFAAENAVEVAIIVESVNCIEHGYDLVVGHPAAEDMRILLAIFVK